MAKRVKVVAEVVAFCGSALALLSIGALVVPLMRIPSQTLGEVGVVATLALITAFIVHREAGR